MLAKSYLEHKAKSPSLIDEAFSFTPASLPATVRIREIGDMLERADGFGCPDKHSINAKNREACARSLADEIRRVRGPKEQ